MPFEIRIDSDFGQVIRACAEKRPERPETWINPPIIEAFEGLHARGYAHSLECWKDGVLVGGLYGLALGGVFCGEIMFSRVPDASKVALVHLAARLFMGGFSVLDAQFPNPHLSRFGAYEVPQDEYVRMLCAALKETADFKLQGKAEKEILSSYLARNLADGTA